MCVLEMGKHGEAEEGKPEGMSEVETSYGLRRWVG